MRVDRIEFKESLIHTGNFWTEDHQAELERTSLLRRIGNRIEDHNNGFPVIPEGIPHDTYVITNRFPWDVGLSRVDGDRCFVSMWTPMMIQNLMPMNQPEYPVKTAEDSFLCNFLSMAGDSIVTHHFSTIDDITLGMRSEDDRTILIIRSCHTILSVPEVPTTLGGDTYDLKVMMSSSPPIPNDEIQGYLIRPGVIWYDDTIPVISQDRKSISLMMRIIITDPCDVARFVVR